VSGLVLAFAAGFVVDALSGSVPGLFALLLGSACAITRGVDRALYLRAPRPWALYVLAYVAFHAVALGLCQRWLVGEGALSWAVVLVNLPGAALLTAAVAIPGLLLYLRIDTDPSREAGLTLAGRGS